MKWSKRINPSKRPSYRWARDPVNLKDPHFVYRTIEMHDDVLLDVGEDGRVIGIEAYDRELTVDDFVRILADPSIRYVFPEEKAA